MGRSSIIFNLMGFISLQLGLGLHFLVSRGDRPILDWLDGLPIPDGALTTLSLISCLLFLAGQAVKITSLTSGTSIVRVLFYYLSITVGLLCFLGTTGGVAYLMLVLSLGIASVVSHDIHPTYTGSIETMFRLIILSVISMYTVISVESGMSWALGLLLLTDNPIGLLRLLYVLILVPLVYAPICIKVFVGHGGFLFGFMGALLLPIMVIALVPINHSPIMVYMVPMLYLLVLVSLFGRYVRILTNRLSGYKRLTIEGITSETSISIDLLAALLPNDVYHRILSRKG